MDIKGVTLTLYGKEEAMRIEGRESGTGQQVTAILMPMKL